MFESLKDRRLEGSTPLEQARFVELYLLDILDEICSTNNICYYLDWGTLLGAFRHNGFIPWDDDIDISMPMEDYRHFLKIAPSLLPKSVMLQDLSRSPNRRWDYAKLRDRGSFYCESITDVRMPCGIFIDIFPIIRMPKVPRWLSEKLCWLQYSAGRHAGESIARPRCSVLLKIVDCFAYMFYRFIKRSAWCIYHLLLTLFPSRQYRPSEDSYSKGLFSQEDLFPTTMKLFEGKQYPVPRHAEKVLQILYGDWRTLPPIGQRHSHATIISATQTPPTH